METIGFIGLGNIGAPMCERLLSAGHEVSVYDLDRPRVEHAVGNGAIAADGPIDCAKRSSILLTSLPRPDHVEVVMVDGGALAALEPGSTWIDLTTNRPDLITELADDAPPGVNVVDAPVSGTATAVRDGQATLFVGGSTTAVRRVSPVLSELGSVIECGPLGAGNVVKLATSQLWFTAAAALGEAYALGMTHGVDLSVLQRAIIASDGDSFAARENAPSVFAGHYDPSFTLEACLQDLGLLSELQRDVDAKMVVTDAARAAFTDAGARYGTHVGEMHVAKRLEDDTGLQFRPNDHRAVAPDTP